MYGIKAAVRRLEFAPETRDMEVTDITNGRFVFKPRPDKPVSLEGLRKAVTKAGYEIEGTWIEVTGSLTPNGRLRVPETGQVFRLEGEGEKKAAAEGRVTVSGTWKAGEGEEVVFLRERRP
ncbi:MAG TPA: hypothetical protein VG477_18255 [Thermoanaerobaculia bacterium]|nr:hypothetical protein [Thermoanaerobaculia bacterium]